jgi:hypothetical protein
MDNTVSVAFISSSGSVLVATTALVLNYRGFASIDARMLALDHLDYAAARGVIRIAFRS